MSTPDRIDRFQGENRFLSNFWVEKNNRPNENYFQAPKTLDEEARQIILNAPTAHESKRLGSPAGFRELSERLGRPITLREDWEEVCQDVMYWSLGRKFKDPDLRARLLATGDAYLEEGNTWCDVRWGVCYCAKHKGTGTNWLGQALMRLRDELRSS
jgi:ribA/ribD-fused uncharacterized protein